MPPAAAAVAMAAHPTTTGRQRLTGCLTPQRRQAAAEAPQDFLLQRRRQGGMAQHAGFHSKKQMQMLKISCGCCGSIPAQPMAPPPLPAAADHAAAASCQPQAASHLAIRIPGSGTARTTMISRSAANPTASKRTGAGTQPQRQEVKLQRRRRRGIVSALPMRCRRGRRPARQSEAGPLATAAGACLIHSSTFVDCAACASWRVSLPGPDAFGYLTATQCTLVDDLPMLIFFKCHIPGRRELRLPEARGQHWQI